MKLQNKINQRFLLLLLSVFSLAGVALFVALNVVVNKNINDILENRAERARLSLELMSSVPEVIEYPDQSVIIRKIASRPTGKKFSDTKLYDDNEHHNVDGRMLSLTTDVQGSCYEITVTIPRFETEDMVSVILYFMLGLFGLIIFILLFSHRWMSVRLWQPFYEAIDQISLFRVGNNVPLRFSLSNIDEFQQLNTVLESMVGKIQADYNNLKEFSENASHEIQTPLAIMRSNLEMVLQDKTLPTQRYQQIQSVFEAASRLSKLSETLLLLSKIENRQFPDEVDVDFCALIAKQLDFVEELLELKKISLELDLQHPFVLKANPYLAEILISNLLNNALRHNVENGKISIASSPGRLMISNTGLPLSVPPEKLFQRFVKHHSGKESTGLGLAIAAEICKNYGLTIEYVFREGMHQIVLGVAPDSGHA